MTISEGYGRKIEKFKDPQEPQDSRDSQDTKKDPQDISYNLTEYDNRLNLQVNFVESKVFQNFKLTP